MTLFFEDPMADRFVCDPMELTSNREENLNQIITEMNAQLQLWQVPDRREHSDTELMLGVVM